MPPINRAAGKSPAQQIADHFRAQIRSGELPPGEQLPSTSATAKEWGVAIATVRAALDTLRAEGLIHSRQGAGVFVRPPVHRTRRDASISRELKRLALKSEEERRAFGAAEADLGLPLEALDFDGVYSINGAEGELTDLLQVAAGTPLLRKDYTSRERATGLLTQRSTTWVPVELVESNPDLLDDSNEPWPGGGMHQFFTVGIEIDHEDDVVTATMPSPDEQQSWGIEDGVPMLRTRSVSYDINDRPVSVSYADYPADRTELAFSTQLERW
jgi:GntR family transcriptional regulator